MRRCSYVSPLRVELRLELVGEDLREEILELAVVRLEDRVLRAEVDGIVPLETVAEARPREVANRVVEVVHPHRDAAVRAELGDLEGLRLATLRRVGDRHRAFAGHLEIRGLVLIAVRVAADDDRLRPSRHQARDVRHDDRLAEDHAAQNVANGSVRMNLINSVN